jgi:cobalt-zinc-cadmium resistance protein CzcA
MPALEEGNLWVRATMPVDIGFEEAGRLVTDMRGVFRQVPEVTTVVSQLGRPDDGTDPTSFSNAEFLVGLKPQKTWRSEIRTKDQLIGTIEKDLNAEFPGVTFNFSQVIQDNVQEAMSGVKGENSIKLFGPDLKVLESKAAEIQAIMQQVRGVKDLGTFHVLGQPNLLIEVDRTAVARYGLAVSDVNGIVQAAVGGQSVTQVFEGEKWFDLVVRFLPQFRKDAQAIRDIQVTTPEAARIPLKQLATVQESIGAFVIYREGTERYIPIKFSVRERDLESTIKEAAAQIARKVALPPGYHIEWHGEYRQLQEEKGRLAKVIPLSLLVILLLIYYALGSFRDALLVLLAVPFALVGGILALAVTRTDFSISAAVGFVSLFGVAIQGALVSLSRIPEYFQQGYSLQESILRTAEVRMRPVMMTTLAAAIGLFPAAIATGIGAQSQQPLARVVVGGMLSSVTLILLVLPVLYQRVHRHDPRPPGVPDEPAA